MCTKDQKMYSYAACLLVCLASAVRGTAAEVLPFTAAAELAVQAMRRPVLVKVDAPNCVDCPKLEEFWAMAAAGCPGVQCGVWNAEGRKRQSQICAGAQTGTGASRVSRRGTVPGGIATAGSLQSKICTSG